MIRFIIKILFIFALTHLLVTCTKQHELTNLEGSQLVRTWIGEIDDNVDTRKITDSGEVTSSYCASTGIISDIIPNENCPTRGGTCGTCKFTITATNGNAGCLPLDTITCTYDVFGIFLTLNCEDGSIIYEYEQE